MNNLTEVVVLGQRSMKDIGIQQTTFDSIALKENIALSMADILTFNSSVYVKSYGRATLSTIAFRGTSPSHTQVSWNGMRISNPMLGMTDFSSIPSFFIDQATLLHGTSSVNETGGGLGGLVRLGTIPDVAQGFNMQYVQGVGSFSTFDEFFRLTFGKGNWRVSSRVVYSSSPNDYKYVNHDKKENIYDEEKNIIGQYHPTERNRSGSYKDFHALQELYYNTNKGNRFGLNLWYINSNRELPMLTTDYGNERNFENRQREETLRSVVSWNHRNDCRKFETKGGFIHTRMAYDYKREVIEGKWATMTHSRSLINTFYGQAEYEYNPTRKWYFSANISAYQHLVRSEDKNIILQDGDKAIVGYDKGRIELSGSASAKWQPVDPIGLSLVIRQEMVGDTWAPVIPAFFIDGLLSRKGNVMLKGSVARNHRFPSLNDLYFLPGGNPNLKSEQGWTYDVGASFNTSFTSPFRVTTGGSVTWFDGHIADWIIWLPTTKGFFSPRNVMNVHAYGIESRLSIDFEPFKGLIFDFNGTYSWTPSINKSPKVSPADKSVGKQLPYVPKHSASLTARLTWHRWSILYKWAYYSERFTMSSNEYTLSGYLPPYFMSNISLEKKFSFRPVDLQFKLAVNNIFDEDYLSVLSRPMPGRNFEFFIGFTPRWSKKKNN